MTRSVTSRSNPPHSLLVEIGMHSVAGKRAGNEDRVACFRGASEVIGLLADGMGGGAIGATMSDQAVRIAGEALRETSTADSRTRLVHAFRLANQALLNLTRVSSRYYEGGSTLVAVLIQSQHGNPVAHIARLGDSRAYLRSASGGVRQIGRDHTYGEELRHWGDQGWAEAPGAHELTYALGAELEIEKVPDFYHCVPLQHGEMILLCSDGLSSYVSHDELDQLLATGTAQRAAERLVQRAQRNGSDDNISALVVRYDCRSSTLPRHWLRLWLAAIGLLLLIIGTLAWSNLRFTNKDNPIQVQGFPVAASITSQSLSSFSSTNTSAELNPTSTRVPTVVSAPGFFAPTTVVPLPSVPLPDAVAGDQNGTPQDTPVDLSPTATVATRRSPVATAVPPRRIPTSITVQSPAPTQTTAEPLTTLPTESAPLLTPAPATPPSATATPGAAATPTAGAGVEPPSATATPGAAATPTAGAGVEPPSATATPGAAATPTAGAGVEPPSATATPGAATTPTAGAGIEPPSPAQTSVPTSNSQPTPRRTESPVPPGDVSPTPEPAATFVPQETGFKPAL